MLGTPCRDVDGHQSITFLHREPTPVWREGAVASVWKRLKFLAARKLPLHGTLKLRTRHQRLTAGAKDQIVDPPFLGLKISFFLSRGQVPNANEGFAFLVIVPVKGAPSSGGQVRAVRGEGQSASVCF